VLLSSLSPFETLVPRALENSVIKVAETNFIPGLQRSTRAWRKILSGRETFSLREKWGRKLDSFHDASFPPSLHSSRIS